MLLPQLPSPPPPPIPSDPTTNSMQTAVAMHEVTHVLGFDATSFTLFRDSLGSPRTPRNPNFPNSVATSYTKTVTCTIECT